MEPISTAIGMGVGLIGSVGKMFAGKKSAKELEALQRSSPVYTTNPEVEKRLALAKTLLNARAPGAATAERNIYTAGANAYGNVERTATDSSTALAMGAGVLGQTDQAFEDLQQKELEDYQRRYGNVTGAQEAVVAEGDKVFQDKARHFQDKVATAGVKAANRSSAWQSLSNFGYGVANLGMSGGFGGVGKKAGYPMAGVDGTGGI